MKRKEEMKKKGSNKFIVNYLNFCVFNYIVHLQQKIGKGRNIRKFVVMRKSYDERERLIEKDKSQV